MKYWLIVMTRDNFHISLEHNLIGLPESVESIASKVTPGDKVIFYLSRESVKKRMHSFVGQFVAVGQIKSTVSRSNKKIWNPIGDKIFPIRCEVDIEVGKHAVDAKPLVNSLDFIANKKRWGLSFFRAIREIGQRDYEEISNKLSK